MVLVIKAEDGVGITDINNKLHEGERTVAGAK
jgi:hypothetical protein